MTDPHRRARGFQMPTRPGSPLPDTEAQAPQRECDPPMSADAAVDLVAERKASGIDEVLDALDEDLVGLGPVKTRVREIAALLLVNGIRRRFGLTSARPNLHMCFTGNPGTGKTTVALRMAELLHRVGCLERGHLVAVTRDDLVGQYVGHTAPKTKEVLKRAMGGVLFIDEAYHLHRADNERDYGQEAIEILLQVMENQRDDLVVIMAGYQDLMNTFFDSNPGMSSRISHHLHFADYGLAELEAIAGRMNAQDGYRFSAAAETTFREYLVRRIEQPRFANARSVRNALERARLRHANRLLNADAGPVGRDDLISLEPEDLLASRVFADPATNEAAERP
jgi:probable Rubsico expression protein CbbX